jgi:hypothetical protein
VGFCGIALVAGGISRELRIDSRIEGIENQIRAVNEQLFGTVSEQAENAESSPKIARKQADG